MRYIMEYNADMWCPLCKKVTEHHIVMGMLWCCHEDNVKAIKLKGIKWAKIGVERVIFQRICLNALYKDEEFCLLTLLEHVAVRDWNALVNLGREQYPEYFRGEE